MSTSLVRPLLETAGTIWSLNLIKQVKMLESVQRRATKLVKTIKTTSIELAITRVQKKAWRYDFNV